MLHQHRTATATILLSIFLVAFSSVAAFSPHSGIRRNLKHALIARRVSSVADLDLTTEEVADVASPADNFIFGLSDSPLQRPKGRTAMMVAKGDSTETQPYQVALVTATMLAHATIITASANELITNTLAQASTVAGDVPSLCLLTFSVLLKFLTITVGSWVAADIGSGVFHWSVDNYGNGNTPVLGSVIAAFQGHHAAPWTITERSLCNNVYKLCIPFGIGAVLMETLVVLSGHATPTLLATTSAFMVWVILSQEFHKWSHMPTPPVMGRWMQQTGISVGKVAHTMHHREPFAGNYCIVSGLCNAVLDDNHVFRAMERAVYQMTGVEPNTWKLDPEVRARAMEQMGVAATTSDSSSTETTS